MCLGVTKVGFVVLANPRVIAASGNGHPNLMNQVIPTPLSAQNSHGPTRPDRAKICLG